MLRNACRRDVTAYRKGIPSQGALKNVSMGKARDVSLYMLKVGNELLIGLQEMFISRASPIQAECWCAGEDGQSHGHAAVTKKRVNSWVLDPNLMGELQWPNNRPKDGCRGMSALHYGWGSGTRTWDDVSES